MGERRCGACGETKALADFHRRSASKDGRAATCISCAADYGKTYRESNAEQLAVSKKDWAHDNGRKVRVSRAKWRDSNRAVAHDLERAWRLTNPDKCRARVSAWRARKRGATVQEDRASYVALVAWARVADAIRCYWCKRKTSTGDRHLDHIIPLAKGGSDTVGNLCVACPLCNQTKNARMPEDYAGQSEMAL